MHRNARGLNALDVACSAGDVPTIRALMEEDGSSADQASFKGAKKEESAAATAAARAVASSSAAATATPTTGSEAAVSLTGVAASSRCPRTGRSALHYAAAEGHRGAVELLLGYWKQGASGGGDEGSGDDDGDGKQEGEQQRRRRRRRRRRLAGAAWREVGSAFYEHATPWTLDAHGDSAAGAARRSGHGGVADLIEETLGHQQQASSPSPSMAETPSRAAEEEEEVERGVVEEWAEDPEYAYVWPSDED